LVALGLFLAGPRIDQIASCREPNQVAERKNQQKPRPTTAAFFLKIVSRPFASERARGRL
jgi:hypothetical protein